jgi:uncharacterized protein (UPF0335 family)
LRRRGSAKPRASASLSRQGTAKASAAQAADLLKPRARACREGASQFTREEDMSDAYNVTADELRQFVEQFEHLEAEKKDIAEQQKDIMSEAKARGYDTKVIKKVIALRKRDKDDIAEEEAILELYKTALGMA